jgi:hypothetical protein
MKVQLVLFILLAFSLLTGCDNARDGIIDVDKDDDEMNSAMAEARQTIDEFWSARDLGGAEFGGLLKVYFFDPDGDPDDGEHMWVRVSRRTGDSRHVVEQPNGLDLRRAGRFCALSTGSGVGLAGGKQWHGPGGLHGSIAAQTHDRLGTPRTRLGLSVSLRMF